MPQHGCPGCMMPQGSSDEFEEEGTPYIDEHGISWHKTCVERLLNYLGEPWREGEREEWADAKRLTTPIDLIAICHRCRMALGDEGTAPNGDEDGYHDKCRKHELVDRGLL